MLYGNHLNFFFALIGFAPDYRFVEATLSLNRLARCLLTVCKKNLRNERVTQILDKENVLKNKYFFDLLYVSLHLSYVTC